MPLLLTERLPPVLRLTLNAPDRLNAFTEPMHAALAQALDHAAKDPAIHALILTGAGRAFCAGQDLNDRQPADTPPDLGDTLERLYNPLVRRLRAQPQPIVCAVNGIAAGAGANLALACDIVLAARSARFIQSFIRLGLVPDSGGTWFLPRLIGPARAAAAMLTGDPIEAETAAAWGLIHGCVADDALAATAEALALRVAVPGAARIKRALAASGQNTLAAQLDLERDLQREAGLQPEYAAGIRDFFARRRAASERDPGRTGHGSPDRSRAPHGQDGRKTTPREPKQ